eukprot:37315_1
MNVEKVHIQTWKQSEQTNEDICIKLCSIFGYPVKMKGQLMGQIGKAKQDAHNTGYWKYSDIHTYPGQSGSALYKETDNGEAYNVYGIHIFGGTDKQSNRGVKINDDKIEWIQKTEKEMIVQMQTEQMNKDKNDQKLKYSKIKRVLKTDRFMNENEINTLEYGLKAYKEEKDDEKGNSKRKGYEKDMLITELCNAFNNNEDYEMQCILTDILITKLQFKQSKRQQCYDLLLHEYCKNYQLNHNNLVTYLVNAMNVAVDWEIKDIETVKHIAKNDPKLNGRIFIKGQPEFKSNIQFAKIFEK